MQKNGSCQFRNNLHDDTAVQPSIKSTNYKTFVSIRKQAVDTRVYEGGVNKINKGSVLPVATLRSTL